MKAAAAAGASLLVPVDGVAEGFPGQEGKVSVASKAVGAPELYTRGVGVYPGAPEEYWGPTLLSGGSEERNLALHRPAFHSSSYDYNLTAQLITDGIRETVSPEWTAVSVDGSELAMDDREILFDHFLMTSLNLSGLKKAIEVRLGGGERAPVVDRLLTVVLVPEQANLNALTFRVFSSEDGHEWRLEGSTGAGKPRLPEKYGPNFGGGWHVLWPEVNFSGPRQARFYRLELECSSSIHFNTSMQWRVAQLELYSGQTRQELGGPYRFRSAWKSLGAGTEWVYVDLGAPASVSRLLLHWIAPAAEGSVQVSDDAEHWRPVASLNGKNMIELVHLATPVRTRYIRLWLTRPATGDGYVLSEFEVYGRGGLLAHPKPIMAADSTGLQVLSGGSWQVERASATTPPGEILSRPGRPRTGGIIATVPGTVLASYLNTGAVPDPNFGNNQIYLSDSYFYADFWYTTEFRGPTAHPGMRFWLNFEGINWKAEVFLNGERLGQIDGGFLRGRFDVTGKLRSDVSNVIAVRVQKNATPGSIKRKTLNDVGKNGGALGSDNPTFHASAGWDWIPTIRGRNTGIWGPVTLSHTGNVTVESPAVSTTMTLPDTSSADVSIDLTLKNHSNFVETGTLHGRFGEVVFTHPVTLAARSEMQLSLNVASHPQLKLENPKLWWPAGYGEHNLYEVDLAFESEAGQRWPGRRFFAGVRQMSYSEDGGALRIFINGRRLVPKGGNWGFSESMLRYRAREYDAAMRYHKEMNFNIVRNWVGQIGDDAFYEACDRHGMLVWQDFWLANPGDGPEPQDDAIFLAGAREVIERIRTHACIGLYCGRNEGYPPEPIDKGLRSLLNALHPAIHYISSSADGVVSGRGPYRTLSPEAYFATEDSKFHSEIGSPAIPTFDSLLAMIPAQSLWPMGDDWGAHDFCLNGAQGGQSFLQRIDQCYGGAQNAGEWTQLAQFLNYDTYRAMFEAQGSHRMGVLLWMSHPCWPTFVWQTYDFYLEPTAAYFGCRKACEPIHIQWNPTTDEVEVVNASAGDRRGLQAEVEVFDSRGKSLSRQQTNLDAPEDSHTIAMKIRYPGNLEPVHLLRLILRKAGTALSTNTYLRAREAGDFRAIRSWEKSELVSKVTMSEAVDRWNITANVTNISDCVALTVKLKVVGNRSGQRILPAIFSDNYLTLLPDESRTLTIKVARADARGERPRIVTEHFR